MTAYLIDTNHATAIMGGSPELNEILVQRKDSGDTFAISVTILSELYFAAYASTRQESNLANIRRLLTHIPVLPFDTESAEEYGRIRAEQRKKGRPIPGTDAQIAAVARLHGLTVLSADRHFTYVDALSVENWL
jgi:tRNA(fMet)-specific endonuclease VapC